MEFNKLKEIDKYVLKCQRCKGLVEKFEHHTTIHYGKNTNILILGEAPANNGWRKSGRCWYSSNGKITGSGRVMNKLLEPYGLKIDDITFVEAIKCFPKSRNNLKICKDNCNSILIKQLELLKPKLIIAMGDNATRSVVDIKYDRFSDVVGKVHKVKMGNSYYDVLPIYHPSPISPKSYKDNVDIIKLIKKYL